MHYGKKTYRLSSAEQSVHILGPQRASLARPYEFLVYGPGYRGRLRFAQINGYFASTPYESLMFLTANPFYRYDLNPVCSA